MLSPPAVPTTVYVNFTYEHGALQTSEFTQVAPDEYYIANFEWYNRMNSALAQKKAKERYVSALQLTSEAIQSPEAVSRDATLLSSLLLDLYEKMTTSVPHSRGPWVSHVNGAFRLVQFRGRDQFKRPVSIRLLVRLCTSLLITCVASRQPIPLELIQLRAAVAEFMDSNDPKWKLMGLMIQFVELRQAAEGCVMSPRYILDSAKRLDEDLLALSKDMPPAWQYETIFVDDCSDRVYGNYYHIYADAHVTQAWNVLRIARIMINEIILEQQQELLDHSRSVQTVNVEIAERSLADESITSLTSEICASVPQYTKPAAKMLNSSHAAYGNKIHSPCYTLLFPLFVAGQSPTTPPLTREWILTQFRFMSKDLGIRNARLVLDILEHGKWVDPWSVYAMLGGYAFVA